ncbi:MAG: TlpA family protein disulfide reductase [Microbacteriaceae bacterium]
MRALATALIIASALAVGGCASNDTLANQLGPGDNFISGDGALVEVAADNRGEPIEFAATANDGSDVSAEALRGSVVVINFWYASCPPCRIEAPELAKYARSNPDGVEFLGVNVYDGDAAAKSFEDKFDVPYPSVLDVSTGAMRLAFAGSLPPNAVPVTIILDREGRVAARMSGYFSDIDILISMVDKVRDEQ